MAFVSAIIGGVATLASGIMGSNAASDAAAAQSAASANAVKEQQRQFDVSQQLTAPTRNLGTGADTLLAQLFGINPQFIASGSQVSGSQMPGYDPNNPSGNAGQYGTPTAPNTPAPNNYWGSNNGANNGGGTYRTYGNNNNNPLSPSGKYVGGGSPLNSGNLNASSSSPTSAPGASTPSGTPSVLAPNGTPDYSGFENTPGFQFALGLGNQAIQRQAAAGGGLYSGNTMTQLSQYNTGFASQHYNDYVQQLLNMAGLGNGAGSAQAANAIATGQGTSNSITNAGNAAAAGSLAQGSIWQNGISQIGNMFSKYGGSSTSTPYTLPADIKNAEYNTQTVPTIP